MLNPKVSIIIANYNYGKFLSGCIESVISQTYSNIELIIVDDGSTDESVELANRYASRFKVLLCPHRGESATRNIGFLISTGLLVMFLDADDYLKPGAIKALVDHWQSDYSKLQFPLDVVDEEGADLGLLMPRCRLDRGRVSDKLLTTGRYITSPGTGNLYARWLLEKIVPIPTETWPQSFDSYASTYAGFLGCIGAVDEPLASYRVHRKNMSHLAVPGKSTIDLPQVESLLQRGQRLRSLIQQIARDEYLAVAPGIVTSHWLYLKLELTRLKLLPLTTWHDLAHAARLMIVSAFGSAELSHIRRVELLSWTLAVVALPRGIVGPFLRFAFDLAPDNSLARRLRRI